MYILPNEAMELLQITTRQGLHKIVVNHNITVKSQGAGKPNLYLKEDLERYKKDNAKNIKAMKNPQVIENAKEIKEKKEKKKQEVINIQKRGIMNKNPLNPIGQEVFDELMEELKQNGTYQDKDISLLQSYCVSYQKYINAINQSEEELDVVFDDFGNKKISPYFQIADKCLSQMDKLAKALGIGARNRIGLEIVKPKKESIFDILNSKESFE